jgi:S-formylglutathione hydrolase FrmB
MQIPVSRRTLLSGSAALAAGTSAALLTGPAPSARADAAPAARTPVTDPYDTSAYTPSNGLRFAEGFPVAHPEWRSVDLRVHTDKVRTFPPSFRVTLPAGYQDEPDRDYPVLLLLHGKGGDFTEWTRTDTGEAEGNGGDVISATADADVITVMPDGGAGSFYSNANAPWPGREAAWETFIIEQVLGFVHAHFRTDPGRMAIGGLSMGGWGALALGQKYGDLFRSVSSYSGPADCRPSSGDGLLVAGTIFVCPVFDRDNHPDTFNPPGATWGPDLAPKIASSYDPIENVERYRGKRVFLRSGDGAWFDFAEELKDFPDALATVQKKIESLGGDVIEAVVDPNLRRFSDALSDAGIDNSYELLPGRTHEWGLWKENFAEDLPGVLETLEA